MIRIFSSPTQTALSVFFLIMFVIPYNANAIGNLLSAKESLADITKLHCEFDHDKTRYANPIKKNRITGEKLKPREEEILDGVLRDFKKNLWGYQIMNTIAPLWTTENLMRKSRVAHTFIYVNVCGPLFSASSNCKSYLSKKDDLEQTKVLNLVTGDSGNQLYAEKSIIAEHNPHPAFLYYSHSDISKNELSRFDYDKDLPNSFLFMENIISRKNGSFKMNIYFDRNGFIKKEWAKHLDIILEGTCSIDESKRLF